MISFQSIFKNLSANSFGMVVNLAIQFIAVPIFIRYWGVELYGEWLVLTAITSYFSMTDIGLSTVTANEFSMRFAANEFDKCRMLFNNNLFFIIVVFGSLYGALLLSGWVLDWKALLELQILSRQEIFVGLLLLVAHILFGMLSGLFNSIYRAKQRYAKAIMLDNSVRVTENALLIIGLMLGFSIIPVILLYTGSRAIVLLIKYWDTRQLYTVPIGLKYVDWKELKSMSTLSFSFLAFPLGNAVLLQGFTLLVNFMLGSKALVLFNTTRTLINFVKSGLSMVNNSVWPEFSLAYGRQDVEGMRKLHQYAVGVSFYISALSVLFLMIFGEYLYTLWLGKKVIFDQILFYSFLLTLIANAIWYTSSVVLVATNQHSRLALHFLIGAFLSILMGFFLLGLSVPLAYLPLALLLLDVILIISVFQQTLKAVDDNLTEFIAMTAKKPISVLVGLIKKRYA